MENNLRDRCLRLGVRYEAPREGETTFEFNARVNRLKRLTRNARDRLRRRMQRERNGVTVSII